MKINICYPANGTNKLFDIHDELKIRPFYEKRMGQEVPGDSLGDEFKVIYHTEVYKSNLFIKKKFSNNGVDPIFTVRLRSK